MNQIANLFESPDYYPITMNFERQALTFVRMSRDTYRDSVFLDTRTRLSENRIYEMRLDDVIAAAASQARPIRPVHYILNTAFCCSTLLARYFELLESCFVLKEPLLLVQLAALTSPQSVKRWNDVFEVAIKLLTRTYEPKQRVIIKPHETCNILAHKLLEHENRPTITFLITPLRYFLLAVLKSQRRRDWVRTRVLDLPLNASQSPGIANIDRNTLTDSQAAAYLWLINRRICRQLASGPHSSRILVINGNDVADSPEEVLPRIANMCELLLSKDQVTSVLTHPYMHQYSKDLSKPYDAEARRQEMAQLERSLAAEVDSGIRWVESHSITVDVQ